MIRHLVYNADPIASAVVHVAERATPQAHHIGWVTTAVLASIAVAAYARRWLKSRSINRIQ